jgi:hypothetical protein
MEAFAPIFQFLRQWRTRPAGDNHSRTSVRGWLCCLLGGALDFIGKQHKKDASKARVTAHVTIGPRDGGGFGLSVKLNVEDRSLPQAELAQARE